MSVSKLESLPNEILTDILEKYLNGMDVIKAFASQLNRRFDALITQCQRFCFDFIRCHKDDFRLCIDLLPAYVDRIEELALSEHNTPGQIHAFLLLYPSFDVFKRLRKLYLHIDMETAEPSVVEYALRSLSNTNLDALSISITNIRRLFSFGDVVVELFRIKTMKKLSIAFAYYNMKWKLLDGISSNIEDLTIHGVYCEPGDLINIFRCTPDLKYFDIDVHSSYYSHYPAKASAEDLLPRLSMVHTAIFNMHRDEETVHNQLELYLRCMPSLHRLEIKMYNIPSNVSRWQTLLQTSLLSLSRFTLENSMFDLTNRNLSNMLMSVQTPFWISKRNFNIIIKKLASSDKDRFYRTDEQYYNRYRSSQLVAQWWIAPRRKLEANLSVLNEISSLYLTTECLSSLKNHFLDNVNRLTLYELNDDLLHLITTHMNCSRIKYLDVSSIEQENNRILTLLSCMRNVTSLRMHPNQLFDQRSVYQKEYNSVKFLDISADQHCLDENIVIIAIMFPHIEHLTINTDDLQNVPMLQIYLPRLRSFTFSSLPGIDDYTYDDYEEQIFDQTLRGKVQFLFQRNGDRRTVWIDEAALQESYWQTTDITSKRPRSSMSRL